MVSTNDDDHGGVSCCFKI